MESEIRLPEPVAVPAVVPVTAAAHPFRTELTQITMPQGATVAEILRKVQPDPVLRRFSVVQIDGATVPAQWYDHLRPKPGHEVIVRMVPTGGGGGGGKNTIRMIGIVVIAIVAAIFGQYYVGPWLAGTLSVSGAAAGAIAAATGAAFPYRERLHRAAVLPECPA